MRLGADSKTWRDACNTLNPIKPGETPADWVWREWRDRRLTMDMTIHRAVHNATVEASAKSGGIWQDQEDCGED